MASSGNAVLCALVATVFWSFLGFALARHLLPRGLALGAAPVVGWAVHNAVGLPLFFLIGFSPFTVVGFAALCVAAGVWSMRKPARESEPAPAIPIWAFAAAAILALAPAVAIVPKFTAGAVHLADPIFDHSKIAIIDAMTRSGLPPVNPIFGADGGPGRLVYYYLWHFSAAQLALPLRATGWEADIGLTWFTAFASLSLMMGLAVWFSGRRSAAVWVLLLSIAVSFRPLLVDIFGAPAVDQVLSSYPVVQSWLIQATWVPQHLASANCVILAGFLAGRLGSRRAGLLVPTLAVVVVAGFESSTW